MGNSHFLNQFDAVTGNAAVCDNACSINIGSYLFNLLLYAVFFFVSITQRTGRIIFDSIYHQASHIYCALSSFSECIVDSETYA